MNETLQIIKERRSIRNFKSDQIREEELQAILEAGFFAPSANNQQPWHFTVVQKKDMIDRLSDNFKELARESDNEYMKKRGDNEGFHLFYHAPTVILLSGDEKNPSAAVDCAAAVQNMLLQAESFGLGSCWIGFTAFLLNSEKGKAIIKELSIPDDYRQIHSVALGYKNINPPAPQRKTGMINYIR